MHPKLSGKPRLKTNCGKKSGGPPTRFFLGGGVEYPFYEMLLEQLPKIKLENIFATEPNVLGFATKLFGRWINRFCAGPI